MDVMTFSAMAVQAGPEYMETYRKVRRLIVPARGPKATSKAVVCSHRASLVKTSKSIHGSFWGNRYS